VGPQLSKLYISSPRAAVAMILFRPWPLWYQASVQHLALPECDICERAVASFIDVHFYVPHPNLLPQADLTAPKHTLWSYNSIVVETSQFLTVEYS